jgi:hypothetical protein
MRYVADPGNQDTASQHDRRRAPRREMKGGAMAVFSTCLGAGTLVRVDLMDASWTGIGVRSPVAVEPGASVSIVPDDAMWPRQTGIVVRCEADEEGGYRVGLLSRRRRAVA